MANTTNFNWETPDDTDLVKDGALAIRTLGNSIDTTLVDLKGGTTGQVLSKTSNTDMDFTWVTSDDANAIQNTIVDAKGDLISASAADVPARLAVGGNGTILVADSSQSTGLKWQGTWTSFTPTYTNLTLGNGTVTARYGLHGNIVFVYTKIVLGTTSSVGSYPTISLPFAPTTSGGPFTCALTDAGSTVYLGTVYLTPGQASVGPQTNNAASTTLQMAVLNATTPFTWGNGDIIEYFLTYEVS